MDNFKKYIKTFVIASQNSMVYRVDFLLSLLSGMFIIIVQCSLWSAIFSSSSDTVINGYTYPQMIIYSIFSGLVSKLVAAGFEGQIAEDIKLGTLSKYLTQPMNYGFYRLVHFIGGKMIQLFFVFLFLFGSLGYFIYIGIITVHGIQIISFLFSIIGGLLLNFCIFFSVSVLAFKMTEVWGVFIAVNQGSYLLSGGIFPLDIFGDRVYRIVHLLPFEYTVFFPVNIINGHLQTEEIFQGIIMQWIWIAIMGCVAGVLWNLGQKKYVAVGG